MKKNFYVLTLLIFSFFNSQAQWTSANVFNGEERDGAFTFVIDNAVFFGGGILSNEFWIFGPSSGMWSELDSIGDGKNRCFSTAFVLGGKGYIVGGDLSFGQSTDEVWCYDPLNNTWTQKNNFTGGARVGMFAFKIGNRAFIGGGTASFGGTGYGTTYKDFYEYDPVNDSWTAIASLPVNAAFASSFVLNGKGYVAFGAESNSTVHKSLYCFDTATMAWTKKADCPGAGRSAGVGFELNGKGYAGIGQLGLTSTFQDFYEYTPATDTWAKMPDYPEDKSGWSVAYVANNNAYVGTGTNLPNLEFSKNIYQFTPSSSTGIGNVWKNTAAVYPNPFTNEITLSGFEGKTVIVTDITGKSVGTYNVEENTPVNLSFLPAGMYVLHAEGFTTKICKQ